MVLKKKTLLKLKLIIEFILMIIPYFQLLCVAGIAICLQGVNYQAIAAVGKSKAMFNWTVIKRAIGLGLVIGGLILWGIKGLLAGMVLQSWLIYLINAYQVHKYVGYNLWTQFQNFAPIALLSIVSFCITYCIIYVLPNCHMYLLAFVRFVVFVIIYIGGSALFKMESYNYVKETLSMIIGKYRKK